MNTKFLMIISSMFLMISGIALTFVPEEIARNMKIGTNENSTLFLQILSSFYLGFGMLN